MVLMYCHPSKRKMPDIEHPRTFRIPISFFRNSEINTVKAKRPRSAITTASPEKIGISLPKRSS